MTQKYLTKRRVFSGLNVFLLLLALNTIIFGRGYWVDRYCDEKKFSHLNPLNLCDEKNVVNKKSYIEFETTLKEYIKKQTDSGVVNKAAVYFRDLSFGPTLGINEYSQFAPASLLKLPMLVTYLNLSESDPDILNTKLYFEGTNNELRQSIKPSKQALPNVTYTIGDLIDFMIKQSDNNSYYALLGYLNQISPNTQFLRDTFIDLGIVDPKFNFDETITVKSYAGIFTQLYNSTLFNKKETSEKALEILSQTDFKDGIVAGVPTNVVVAHKFGERFDEDSRSDQLHDCGIVYYPRNPYLICIMTRGSDMNNLKKVVSEISRMFYEEFDSRRL